MRNAFLATLSHELRAPLTSVIGFADLLVAGVVPIDSPQHKQYLEHILNRSLHLLQLINDMLDISRVDAGSLALEPEPVDLNQLIAGVVDVLHTQIVRKSLVLTVDVERCVQHVVVDAARLKQALAGLLHRAVDESPESGRIEVRVRPQGSERFRLTVLDSGPSITSERQASVFDEFGKNRRHVAADGSAGCTAVSTGLGLALARRLVQAQGGSVGVRSVPGHGAALFIEMPCARPGTAR